MRLSYFELMNHGLHGMNTDEKVLLLIFTHSYPRRSVKSVVKFLRQGSANIANCGKVGNVKTTASDVDRAPRSMHDNRFPDDELRRDARPARPRSAIIGNRRVIAHDKVFVGREPTLGRSAKSVGQ